MAIWNRRRQRASCRDGCAQARVRSRLPLLAVAHRPGNQRRGAEEITFALGVSSQNEKEDRVEFASATPASYGGLFIWSTDSPQLTPAERKVAELLLCGHSDREIASALRTSRHIIKLHLRSMFRKFELFESGPYAPRVRLAVLLHEWRNILGVRCETCEHLRND
jgi:DNA-binding CsgD family transcriptional regulator